jgi:hypothetical protein
MITSHQKKNDYNLKYVKCLQDANKCHREACRSIFAHLTEMNYCLNRERKCVDLYENELTIIENCYNDIDKARKLLYKPESD